MHCVNVIVLRDWQKKKTLAAGKAGAERQTETGETANVAERVINLHRELHDDLNMSFYVLYL